MQGKEVTIKKFTTLAAVLLIAACSDSSANDEKKVDCERVEGAAVITMNARLGGVPESTLRSVLSQNDWPTHLIDQAYALEDDGRSLKEQVIEFRDEAYRRCLFGN